MDNNNFQIFTGRPFGDIRFYVDDVGEPQFCLDDICKAVRSQLTRVKDLMPKDEVSEYTIHGTRCNKTLYFVNEDGLYDALILSRNRYATDFRKWLSLEVLPQVRKHKDLFQNASMEQLVFDPDFLICFANQIKKEISKRMDAEKKLSEQEEQILSLQATIEHQSAQLSEMQKSQLDSEHDKMGSVEMTPVDSKSIGTHLNVPVIHEEKVIHNKKNWLNRIFK